MLQAQRIELDRATDTGVAHGGVLKFKGIPLLPVPRVSFPLSDKRKSGLLPPTIGIDSVSGFEVEPALLLEHCAQPRCHPHPHPHEQARGEYGG